jgi:hypothetical protein
MTYRFYSRELEQYRHGLSRGFDNLMKREARISAAFDFAEMIEQTLPLLTGREKAAREALVEKLQAIIETLQAVDRTPSDP